MNKRDFLKRLGLGSVGIAGSRLTTTVPDVEPGFEIASGNFRKEWKRFNMSGYAAPKIDTVRIGYIGVGSRGEGAVQRILNLKNIEVRAICDIRAEKAEFAKKTLRGNIQ